MIARGGSPPDKLRLNMFAEEADGYALLRQVKAEIRPNQWETRIHRDFDQAAEALQSESAKPHALICYLGVASIFQRDLIVMAPRILVNMATELNIPALLLTEVGQDQLSNYNAAVIYANLDSEPKRVATDVAAWLGTPAAGPAK